MGYVAIRGGEDAIQNAEALYHHLRAKGPSSPLSVQQIREQLPLAVDRVMGEGGLCAPGLAAACLKQSGGDTLEAAFLLRAYRSSVSRIGATDMVVTGEMRIARRISAAFREIPGGQILGATPDYTHRLIRFELLEEDAPGRILNDAVGGLIETDQPIPDTFPKVVDMLREEGLISDPPPGETLPRDITLQALEFPAPRSARLQMLARAETGGILALAYASMRGYGQVHPVVGELRVGDVPLRFKGAPLGWMRVTECEVIAKMERGDRGGLPQFTLGYGLCFGHNEIKAISMAVLDRALGVESPSNPTEDQEFVLLHTDGIEAAGFCAHYKLPHYVTFQADLDQIRGIRKGGAGD